MKNIYWALLLAIFNLACGDDKTDETTPAALDSKQYFPVRDFLKSEIRYVDSLPGGIKMYEVKDGRTDSSYIDAATFDRLALEFIPPDIDSASLHQHFEEQSFFDNSVNASTFIYSARSGNPVINRIHVLSSPDAAYDKVTSIFMEKMVEANDSLTLKKMSWKPGKEFTINSEIRFRDNTPIQRQLRVVWDSWEEQE